MLSVVALTVVQPVQAPLPGLALRTGPHLDRHRRAAVGASTSRVRVSQPTVAPASMTADVKVDEAAYGPTRSQSTVSPVRVVGRVDAASAAG